jgi:TatD DNase family protein
MKVIDIHCHLQFADFDNSRVEVIQELENRNWGTIVVGTNIETSRAAVELANKHENIWATIGQHPTELNDFDTAIYRSILGVNSGGLRHHLAKKKIIAIGECGLDYYRTPRDRVYDVQVNNLRKQIELAAEFQLPLMLHGRPSKGTMNAYLDMIEILSQRRDELPEWPGNVHFFVGNREIAKRFLDLNFTLSFDGPITFARDYDQVIKYIPSDMIHAETDAPYAAPVPHRGKQNSPLYVDEVIKALFMIRGEKSLQSFQMQLVANARRVFNL